MTHRAHGPTKAARTGPRPPARRQGAQPGPPACGPADPILGVQATLGNRTVLRMLDRAAPAPAAVPPVVVQRVLRASGQPLDQAVRADMEARFGRDFGQVRVHTDPEAAASARAVGALAYTVGEEIVFGSGQHQPHSSTGRRLLAHELAHVVQQSHAPTGLQPTPAGIAPAHGVHERQADAVADAVLAGGSPPPMAAVAGTIQRRAAPYIKKITVHLAPPQNAELEWEGTPPADASGKDGFTVSTGKGYGDPGDPPGTCLRDCCKDADTQCAPPWNRPDKVGACCTYHGSSFWTGTPLPEHNGWSWWTPIQPWYSQRGIALHQHTEVTGQPIGHGCVRMDDENAKRIHDFSNGRKTNVTIDGRAAPVDCKEDRRCDAPAGGGAMREGEDAGTRTAETPAVPGLEGVMT
jgi:hypothetical protein